MFKGDEGQGLVEYALVLILVAVVLLAIVSLLGPQINEWLAWFFELVGLS